MTVLKIYSAKQESADCREIAMKFSTVVITSCGFGIKSNALFDEDDQFREVSRRMFEWNIIRKFQMGCYFVAPMLVKLFRMKFLQPEAANHLRDCFIKSLKEREISKGSRGDAVDVLMQIRDKAMEKGVKLDVNMLASQAIQFFFAGFESTGGTISFALYELALNPTIQDRLRREIFNVLKEHEEFTYESLQDMPYLDMTVSETLRKYPLLTFVDRRCTKDYPIPGTDVVIEKGIPVYITLIGIHRDPDYYPDPEKFDPERFTNENKTARTPATYMPFGDGPHNCIGSRLGILIAKTALVRILSNFAVERCADTPAGPIQFSPVGFIMSPTEKLFIRFKQITM